MRGLRAVEGLDGGDSRGPPEGSILQSGPESLPFCVPDILPVTCWHALLYLSRLYGGCSSNTGMGCKLEL